MYSQYYGLRQDPFGVTPDPQYLYLGGIHAEALASLIYGIENNRGFLTLIGPPGTGKTTLLFHLLESFRATAHTAFIFQTKCTSDEFLRYLLHELGIDDSGKDLVHANNLFNELLLRAASSGKRVLVIIDEAQNLDRGVLETVRLLSNFETPHSKLLQIILAGQPGLAKELAHYDLRQLRQRLAAVIHLRPLTSKESSEYIDLRLKIAGYGGPPLFTQNARELLIDQSEGIPRNINILCFNALSIGCALRRRVINEDIIQEVIEDSSLEEKPSQALASDTIGVTRRDQLPAPVAVSQPLTTGVRRSAIAPVIPRPNSTARTIPKGQSSPGTVANRLPNGIATQPKSSKDAPRSGRPTDFGPREQSVIENLNIASRPPGHAPKVRARRSNSLPFTLTLLLFVLLWSAAVIWRFEFQTSSEASAPRTGKSATQNNSAVAASPGAGDSVSSGTDNSGRPKPQTNPTTTPARPSPATTKVNRIPTGDTSGRSAIQPASAEALDLTTRSETAGDRSGMPSAIGGANETEPVDPFSGLAHSNASLPTASNRAIESVASAPTMSSISLSPSPRKSTPSYFVAEAELMRSIVPEYPEQARRIKLEGSVELMATIARDGSVQRIERLSGNPILADAASRSVRHWHYRPASVNGRPVEARAKIVLNFSLRSKP